MRAKRSKQLMAFLADLYEAFPGFADDSDVNGADLVDWLSGRLASLPKPKGVVRS